MYVFLSSIDLERSFNWKPYTQSLSNDDKPNCSVSTKHTALKISEPLSVIFAIDSISLSAESIQTVFKTTINRSVIMKKVITVTSYKQNYTAVDLVDRS
jgi:hypothetical protein